MYKVKCDSCQALAINGHASHETGCTGVMQYIGQRGTYLKARVWSLDVWGNKNEGFEVNDRREVGKVMFKEDGTDLLKQLKNAGLLNKKCRFSSFDVEWPDERDCYVNWKKTDEPLYQLEVM